MNREEIGYKETSRRENIEKGNKIIREEDKTKETVKDYVINILVKGLVFGLLAGSAHLIAYRLTLDKLLSQNNL